MARKRLAKTKVMTTVGKSKPKTTTKADSNQKAKARGTTTKGVSTPDSMDPIPDNDRPGNDDEMKNRSSPFVPDPTEWADQSIYITYNSFRRQGAGGSMRVGEFVYIWGNEGNESNQDPYERTRWLGKIMAIRAAAKDKVFMEVAWCYTSVAQLKESNISFPQKVLAENECVMSDLRDVISVWCAEERATVKRFDESDPWQEDINIGEDYYKSEVVPDKAGRLKVVSIRPNPKGRKLYKPLPLGSTPMVYCPRPGCLKWHHQSQIKSIPETTEEQLLEMQSTGLELLDTRPRDRSLSLDPRPESTSKVPSAESEHDEDGGEEEEDEESEGWGALLRSASSSITRGTQSIVGNTVPIIEAREVVAIRNSGESRWRGMMKDWFGMYESDEEEEAGRWICPGCKGVI